MLVDIFSGIVIFGGALVLFAYFFLPRQGEPAKVMAAAPTGASEHLQSRLSRNPQDHARELYSMFSALIDDGAVFTMSASGPSVRHHRRKWYRLNRQRYPDRTRPLDEGDLTLVTAALNYFADDIAPDLHRAQPSCEPRSVHSAGTW